jgi:hypothetical protein
MHVVVALLLHSEKIHEYMYTCVIHMHFSPRRASHFRFGSSLPSSAIYSDTNFQHDTLIVDFHSFPPVLPESVLICLCLRQ